MTNPLLLTRATAEIRKLTEAGRALIRAVSLGDILRLTVDRAADLLSVDRVVLLLADERGLLSAAAACGIDESVSSGLQSIHPQDAPQRLEGALGVAAGRLLAVPLAVEDRVAGVLAAVATDRADIAASQEWLLAALADQAAAAIEHRRLRESEPHPGQRVVFAVESSGIGIWEYVPATGRLSWTRAAARCSTPVPTCPIATRAFWRPCIPAIGRSWRTRSSVRSRAAPTAFASTAGRRRAASRSDG